jgi:4-diphosphocytidyl-2-C-methyl-D-erythritol kinase
MRSLFIDVPSKINLFLGVGEVRPDGYHSVRTVMHTLALSDRVVLTPADHLSVSCEPDLGIPAAENLAYRAAEQFSSLFGTDVLLDIHVTKRVPLGAGLGGGSADAAGVLAGLAYWADLPLDDSRLARVARAVGADVPFLLRGGAALMTGRGDELVRPMKPIRVPVVLVKPRDSVATAAAYRAFDAAPLPAGDLREVTGALRFQDAAALGASLINNMTAASTSLVPEIGQILRWLKGRDGILGAAMAGSGSAVFGLCADLATAKSAVAAGHDNGWWSQATETGDHGPVIVEGDEGV